MASNIARMHAGFCQKHTIYPPAHAARERKCLRSVRIHKGETKNKIGAEAEKDVGGRRTGIQRILKNISHDLRPPTADRRHKNDLPISRLNSKNWKSDLTPVQISYMHTPG